MYDQAYNMKFRQILRSFRYNDVAAITVVIRETFTYKFYQEMVQKTLLLC